MKHLSALALPLAAFAFFAAAPLLQGQSSPQSNPATVPPSTAPATLPETPAPATAQQPASQAPASQLPDAPGAAAIQQNIQPTGPLAVFDTTMGRLTCKLFDKQSPLAATNFVALATGTKDWTDPNTSQKVHGKRFYDGTTFHRVIPQFMIQGGDRRGDGTGDAGFLFDNENTPGLTFNIPGRLAMANSGPNTNGTQFFITERPYPDLDGKYTIFGQCDTHSVLMVASIARVDRDRDDKPLTPVVLNKLTIVRDGDPMPPLPAGDNPAVAEPAATTTTPN